MADTSSEDTAAWLKPGFEGELFVTVPLGRDSSPYEVTHVGTDTLTVKRRCTATSKAGTPCRMPPRLDAETCLVHSMTPEERKAKAKDASTKSTELRQSRAEKRQEAVERSKLGFRDALAVALDEERTEVLRVLLAESLRDSDRRTLLALIDQAYGKNPDHVVTTAGEPYEMDMSQLNEWLHTMSESPTVPETQS